MPGINGAEVTHLLKQRPNPPISFVVPSDATPRAGARRLAAAAVAFLVKAANLKPQYCSVIQDVFAGDIKENNREPCFLHEPIVPTK